MVAPDSYGAPLVGVSSSQLEEIVLTWFQVALESGGRSGDNSVYEVMLTGGSDSTKPDIHIRNLLANGGDDKGFYAEVKKAMAAAGYQCILRMNAKTGKWGPSSPKLFSHELLKFMHDAVSTSMNKVAEQEERGEEASGYIVDYSPTGTELESVYGILQNKYREANVRFFVSVRDNGECCIFDPQDMNALAENIDPNIVVRPKTSGSSAVKKSEISEVNRLLSAYQMETEVLANGKKIVVRVKNFEDWGKDEVSLINKELDTRSRRDNIRGIKSGKLFPYVGNEGIVRTRSETMSMTFLIQTHLSSESESVSFEGFAEHVLSNLPSS